MNSVVGRFEVPEFRYWTVCSQKQKAVVFSGPTPDPGPFFPRLLRLFFITWVFLRGDFFRTPRKNTPDFKIYGLLFSHFITWVKKVRGVFNINAMLSLNFEISRGLSTHHLSTLRHFQKENSIAFWT